VPQLIVYLLGPIVGYLLGAIPFAFVIGKAHGVDIRKVGSGNIGATNLGRTLGKRYFWQAFFLDAAKGFVPVLVISLLVRHWQSDLYLTSSTGHPLPAWSPLLTAIACMLGHVFPVYLKFKGGKGVSTSFGVVLGFWPLYTVAGLASGLVFVVVLMAYRYISLASIVSSLSFVIFVALLGSWSDSRNIAYHPWHDLLPLLIIGALLAAVIILRHRSNMVRLYRGTEPKIGQKQIDKARMP